jgi:Rrf2 family transcriptional regulator, nitric oxide-sensitive transcriptional repressor
MRLPGEQFGIPRNHLTKVVRELGDAGFVLTHRGAGGGLRLARPAGVISIGEMVRRLEARNAIVRCFRRDGGACVLTPRCRLKARLKHAAEVFLKDVDRTTLAECAVAPGPALLPRPDEWRLTWTFPILTGASWKMPRRSSRRRP